jgi:ABC-2 type transport system permease protein
VTEFFRSIFRSLIRTLSFPRKEIVEILRQPRLVLTLVAGPFLILLLVGVGYRSERPPLRTVFVVAGDNPLKGSIEGLAGIDSPMLSYAGSTPDRDAALQQLRRNEIDLVVIAPDKPYETIQANQQATFAVYHREIDPTQAAYVGYLARVYTDEANRELLRSLTAEGQSNASGVEVALAEARTTSGALREAVQRGDTNGTREQQSKLDGSIDNLELAVGASLAALSSLSGTMADSEDAIDALQADMTQLRESSDAVTSSDPAATEVGRITEVEGQLTVLENRLKEFRQIDPQVLVSPFRSETQSITAIQPRITDFFAPAVIVLLLQHLIITFAALSLVRDRRLGIVEVYRISPLSSLEILVGKYLSYLLLGGFLAAVLTLILVYVLNVPMIGRWADYAVTIALVLFGSLGIGFVISLLSQTDTQAVQYSMIVLLASVFLSGFLMNLLLLWEAVRVVSWTLPATYGIALLQNVALRGEPLNPLYVAGLGVLGLVFFFVAYLLLRRIMSAR